MNVAVTVLGERGSLINLKKSLSLARIYQNNKCRNYVHIFENKDVETQNSTLCLLQDNIGMLETGAFVWWIALKLYFKMAPTLVKI